MFLLFRGAIIQVMRMEFVNAGLAGTSSVNKEELQHCFLWKQPLQVLKIFRLRAKLVP